MQTHTYTTYSFDELSSDAQEKAIRDSESYLDHEWYDGVYDLAKEAGAIIGLTIEEIYFSGFWSQGDGASINALYQYQKGWKAELTKNYGSTLLQELTSIGQAFQDAQASNLYQLNATTKQTGRYHSQATDVYHSEDRYRDLPEGAEDGICEAITDFTHWIYKTLEQEYDYLTSDKAVKEAIIANDWQFTKAGVPA